MSSYRDRLERLANQTFEEFQAEIRAGERICAEADLYWRTNRWAEDGRDAWAELSRYVETLKPGELSVIAFGSGKSTFSVRPMDEATAERYRSLYHSTKPCSPGQGRIFRR